ncbi:hypothetical protein KQX54_014815 [Cotesia glomerata]|uniref:Uncharacterized protein n=1 Tax=Cotesia glomerata TaxID=32391 RepID=A0AAV7IWQ0_COTGL|nr:hypothetical protein KQX54_014815 [Cotesia glomerata]
MDYAYEFDCAGGLCTAGSCYYENDDEDEEDGDKDENNNDDDDIDHYHRGIKIISGETRQPRSSRLLPPALNIYRQQQSRHTKFANSRYLYPSPLPFIHLYSHHNCHP